MKRFTWITLTLFLFTVIFTAVAGTALAADKEKKILLKVPMAYPSKLPGLGTTILWMEERVEMLSGGTIKIKVYEPGELIPAFEMLDAVNAGKVNASYGISGYWSGKISAAAIFHRRSLRPGSQRVYCLDLLRKRNEAVAGNVRQQRHER